tara:strand:- start:493 stop:723 length:231 start_codon:yes stop_codon:yes gene_type:complete
MQEVTLKKNNMSITLTNPDGESTEELFELMSKAVSWIENYKIVLDDVFCITMDDFEDEPIFCEGEEPKEEREIDGL